MTGIPRFETGVLGRPDLFRGFDDLESAQLYASELKDVGKVYIMDNEELLRHPPFQALNKRLNELRQQDTQDTLF